ncbi:MAG TPA: hypothetical protein VFQ57_07040 [Sphingomonas sp.]|jgi:hypothetical protein|nr:hypothetical protein [Sphingomonas sp.]
MNEEERTSRELELWGGHQCTVNRVGDHWFDQTIISGHEHRIGDLTLFGEQRAWRIRGKTKAFSAYTWFQTHPGARMLAAGAVLGGAAMAARPASASPKTLDVARA